MFCSHCNEKLTQGVNFCPSCGHQINNESELIIDSSNVPNQENVVSKSSLYFGIAIILIFYVTFYNLGLGVTYIDLAGLECESSDFETTGFTDLDDSLAEFDNDWEKWCKETKNEAIIFTLLAYTVAGFLIWKGIGMNQNDSRVKERKITSEKEGKEELVIDFKKRNEDILRREKEWENRFIEREEERAFERKVEFEIKIAQNRKRYNDIDFLQSELNRTTKISKISFIILITTLVVGLTILIFNTEEVSITHEGKEYSVDYLGYEPYMFINSGTNYCTDKVNTDTQFSGGQESILWELECKEVVFSNQNIIETFSIILTLGLFVLLIVDNNRRKFASLVKNHEEE